MTMMQPSQISPRMSVPTQSTLDTYIECDARRPGPVLVNINNVCYFYPDENGLAVAVFQSGEGISLNDTYAAIRTALGFT